ncbi:ABC transporter ATP-binding protein [Aquihabitans daechungensis]|uniref:ABC transporter ATP-binding protein n=1 Tax=Aquihabitans daechungensis TaxID=1052257 RepID=UPI003B9FE7FB
MADTPLLSARELTVRFGGHVAVSEVDLAVRAGCVTGLIGPNGAGKTTTFNALCGSSRSPAGGCCSRARTCRRSPPTSAPGSALGRTFQRLETFSLLTVRENVLAGAEFRQRRSGGGSPDQVADELLEQLGLGDVADERVDGLPTGRARLVEVARALANGPRVLLLDEPSSGLNEAETAEFATVLHQLTDGGLAVLLVEHDMSLVMSACEDIYVLDFGRIIATGDPATVQADEKVRAAYLGDDEEPTPVPQPAAASSALPRSSPWPSTRS